MKKLVEKKRVKGEQQEAIFRHDCTVEGSSNSQPPLCFRYSSARQLLADDLKSAIDDDLFVKPMSLWKSRQEYQQFTLKTFRSIYALPYWNAKRNKNKHRHYLEKAEQLKNEFDDLKLAEQMKATFK